MQILFIKIIIIIITKQESVFVMGTQKLLPLAAEKCNSKNVEQRNSGKATILWKSNTTLAMQSTTTPTMILGFFSVRF
jgi:hypothetical protein